MASIYNVRMCVAGGGGSILWLIRKVDCFGGECRECQANLKDTVTLWREADNLHLLGCKEWCSKAVIHGGLGLASTSTMLLEAKGILLW